MSNGDLPLPTLLSQALVAFTIEFDNEFEHKMPHRTTKHSSGYGPWLVSMAMYLNCRRFVGDDGRDRRRAGEAGTHEDELWTACGGGGTSLSLGQGAGHAPGGVGLDYSCYGKGKDGSRGLAAALQRDRGTGGGSVLAKT